MRKLQIGVMGSAADTEYDERLPAIAEKIGELLAREGCVLVYGAEKDCDSLSTAAARGAIREKGTTLAITYGKGKELFDNKTASMVVSCGLERGGGREFVMVNSCDAIIALRGGSGTLTEMAIAYQSGIPIICMTGLGGWSDELAGRFMDDRQRLRCEKAQSPEEAVRKAVKLAAGQSI